MGECILEYNPVGYSSFGFDIEENREEVLSQRFLQKLHYIVIVFPHDISLCQNARYDMTLKCFPYSDIDCKKIVS
jgi:hypothetical protein